MPIPVKKKKTCKKYDRKRDQNYEMLRVGVFSDTG